MVTINSWRHTGLLAPLVLVCVLASPCFAQQSTDKVLKQTISGFESTDEPIDQILGKLSKSYGVPIGLEKIAPKAAASSGERRISVKVEKGTVRDILDSVIRADPRYEWKEVAGVINVLPRRARNPILEVPVSSFKISDVNWMDVRQALQTTAEIKGGLERMGLRERSVTTILGSGNNDLPKFSLDMRDTTLRGILNEILKVKGYSFWIFSRYGSHNQYVSIQAIV